MNTLDKLKHDPVNRRAFLQRMGAAGLGVAAIALLDGCGGGNGNGQGPAKTIAPGSTNPNTNPTGQPVVGNFPVRLPGNNQNEQVLNFALTLEILEADLYRQALNIASGKAITSPLSNSPSDYTLNVGAGGINSAAGFAYLRDFAFVEAAHRDFLQAVIPDNVEVKRNPNGYTFGPLAPPANPTLKDLLTSLYPLEEEGVSAYLGAAPFITDLGILQTAVTIYSTEARHSAAIAYILGLDTGPSPAPAAGVGARQSVVLQGNALPARGPNNESSKPNVFEYFIPPTTVVQNITPLLR